MVRFLASLFLLGGVSMAYTAPPAQPILELKTQGLRVDAQWSAVGATGYRLFTAPQDNPDQVDMVDMGNTNQISAVMDHGTAMHVYVQAYNEDGDSPYSEMKSFVLVDPTIDKTPEQLKPEAQSLAFQAVILDTPVTFLPNDESAAVQEDTVRRARTRSSKVTYGPEFDEGRISMTVHIAPGLVRRESVELALCLGVADVCEPLQVWNSEQQQYTETLTVYDLPDDVEKSVYLELRIPAELRTKLLNQLNEAQKYVVYASNLSGNHADELVQVAEIPIANLNDQAESTEADDESFVRRATRSCSSNSSSSNKLFSCRGVGNGLKCAKSFGKNFSNGTFGIEFEVTPEVWAYNPGTSLGTAVDLTPTLFGQKLDGFAEAEAFVIKNKGKLLTADASITILGIEVYSYNKAKPKYSNWTPCSYYSMTGKCSERPASDSAAGEGGNAGDDGVSMSSIFRQQKKVTKEAIRNVMVGFLPVELKGTVAGTVTAAVSAGVDVFNDHLDVRVEGGPSGDVTAMAAAAVSMSIASTAVHGGLTLIQNDSKLGVTSTLPFDLASVPTFKGDVTNRLQGPDGHLSLVAGWTEPAFAIPPWREKRQTYTLISWQSFNRDFTLLKWGNDGCEAAGQSSADIPSATAYGVYLPGSCPKKSWNSSNWMAAMDDDKLLMGLAIPGTHDSGAYKTVTPGETQDWTITEQLESGIRFLDIRLAQTQDDDSYFEIKHGPLRFGNFNELVMEPVKKFLNAHPSETILMSIKRRNRRVRGAV
jgi:hypothetical protein